MSTIQLQIDPVVTDEALHELFTAAWEGYQPRPFQPVLSRSLAYVCAFESTRMVGFVNLAWDGGIHAFLLDTTVHPDFQRRGIGEQLVRAAIEAARERGIEWVHVDYEPHLEGFYQRCGFMPTLAGLVRVNA